MATHQRTPQKRFWRTFYKVDPAAETQRQLNDFERRGLMGDLKRHGLREPVVLRVFEEGGEPRLLDGRHRLDFLEELGIEVVDADGHLLVNHRTEVIPDDASALAYVWSLNFYRRHLDADDRRKQVKDMLREQPTKSDRLIAKQIGASPTTIGKDRKDLEASGAVSSVDTTTDKHGRKQSRKKKPAAKKDEIKNGANLTAATVAQNAASAPLPKDLPGELRTEGAGELKQPPNITSNDKSSSETKAPTAASNGIPTQNFIVTAWNAGTDQAKTDFLKKCATEFSFYGFASSEEAHRLGRQNIALRSEVEDQKKVITDLRSQITQPDAQRLSIKNPTRLDEELACQLKLPLPS
jgi:ParB-like chromosome segregation protein Spo0J